MKLAFVISAIALTLAGLPASGHAGTAPATTVFAHLEAGKNQTVVVYGTSLTHGGAWTISTKQWFEQQYPGKVKFINSGGPGKNSDWGLENLKTKVLDFHPDLVFVEFAYNDAHDKFKMPVERGADNLKKIIEGIRGQNPDTVIVLQNMNVGWDAPNGNRSLSVRPALEDYYDNYRKMARAEGIPLLDHSIAWKKLKETDLKKFQSYVPDGTHPSAAGSNAITWPTVKIWLETTRAAVRPTTMPPAPTK